MTNVKLEKIKKSLVGLKLEEAIKQCNKNKIIYRTRIVDNVPRIGTADLKLNRVNFIVNDNIVTDITFG